MHNNISMDRLLRSLVPITRFNKGEANKIFEEVKETGFKIVIKNNVPTCVLITPEAYAEMLETIEDYHLLLEAEKRMSSVGDNSYVSADQVMDELGIKQSEIDDCDPEIE